MPFRLACALAALALLALPAFAQQRLTGEVRDASTNAPLAGVSVSLGPNSIPSVESTDVAGRFTFANVRPGQYQLEVSSPSYYPARIDVELSPRETRTLEITLDPAAHIDEQVTVRASRSLLDAAPSVTSITLNRERLGFVAPGRRVNLSDTVSAFVSSAVNGHDNLVHLRGNELSLNTFVNGVSFFDNPHQLFTPGLAPDVIQSANVVVGDFPAEFGNRFGGILDVVTRSGFDADNHGSLTYTGGSFLRTSVAADYGGHTDRFGYFVYGQGFESDHYLNAPTPDRLHDFGRGARVFAHLDFVAGEDDTIRLTTSGAGANFEQPNRADEDAVGRDAFDRSREQTALLSWEHLFSQHTLLVTSLYERLASERLLPTTDGQTTLAFGFRNDLTIGLKSDLSTTIGSSHTVKAGIDLMMLSLREDFSLVPRENLGEDEKRAEAGRHGDDEHEELPSVDFRGRRTGGQVSAYVQDRIALSRLVTANVGLRYDQYSVAAHGWALSPRLSISVELPRMDTVLYGSYDRFFSPPPIENQLLSTSLGVGPPGFERANQFEVGARHAFGDHALLRVSGYWRTLENSFETTELFDTRTYLPTTFAEGEAYGLETWLEMPEIRRLGLSGWLGYTAQRVTQTTPVSGGFSDENLPPGVTGPPAFDQVHTAVAGAAWHEARSGVFAGASLEYGSGTPAELPGLDGEEVRVRLPAHTVGNLYAGIDLLRHERTKVTLRFDVENVSDRVYRIGKESEATPVQYSAPRYWSGSLRVNF